MGPIHMQVRYRPIRIGWCVKNNDLEEIRKALRFTHTFWGGRFNPIIPLDDPALARLLIRTFRVDCLYCISESAECSAIKNEFKHLIWPNSYDELYVDYFGRGLTTAAFLDVYHPARHLYEGNVKDRESPTWHATLLRWDPSDHLADVFLATFGGYPDKNDVGKDYEALFLKYLAAEEINISALTTVPTNAFREYSPSALTGFDLRPINYEPGWDTPGLYYGDSSNSTDLINFWNLRASGIDVLFYDPAFRSRLGALAEYFIGVLKARPKDRFGSGSGFAIWNRSESSAIDLTQFGGELRPWSLSDAAWNGANIKPAVMGFDEKPVLGTELDDGRISVTFELPPKPFFDDDLLHGQTAVVTVHPLVQRDNVLLRPPFFPRLNEYYGREVHFEYNAARSERDGLGIVESVTSSSLTIRALEIRSLVQNLFDVFGTSAKPSDAGLVGLRLLDQMGGIRGCHVFRNPGVRQLIRAHPPGRSFTRSRANQMIRQIDPVTGRPQLSDDHGTHEDPFRYLLEKGVFRAGLCFHCPNCELESWVHLDDIRTLNQCEYCGKQFNVTPQLKDRDWAYRRSGLFGRDDNQGGGVPVALTLMQLQNAMRDRILGYTTGTNLNPTTANIRPCETDFVLIAESPRERIPQIVIGECKSDGGVIEPDDTQNMGLVADALAARDCEVFILFSKTGNFTSEEVDRCKRSQGSHRRRVILLSKRELEPYYPYTRTSTQFEISPHASSLEQMVRATHDVYFEPKPRQTNIPTSPEPPASSSASYVE
jgi:hypothetical protein